MYTDVPTCDQHRHVGLKAASERYVGLPVGKVRTMELFNLITPLVEALFTSTVSVQPGLLFLLFFVGLLFGWLFGH
jgi:hypothetical protein